MTFSPINRLFALTSGWLQANGKDDENFKLVDDFKDSDGIYHMNDKYRKIMKIGDNEYVAGGHMMCSYISKNNSLHWHSQGEPPIGFEDLLEASSPIVKKWMEDGEV